MDYRKFYKELFAPLEASIGRIDRDTIVAIVGFDAGGPLNFCTIGRDSELPTITYVSCELAVREEQQRSEFGRYELLVSCDDEHWVRSIVTDIGRMSSRRSFRTATSWTSVRGQIQMRQFKESSSRRSAPAGSMEGRTVYCDLSV